MGTHLRTELVLDGLNMAVWQRRPEQVILHSDQGTQYTSIAFGLRFREVNVKPSMGSVGDEYDNALCESFFATLECELLDRQRFSTQARGEDGRLRLHRGLLQPAASPLLASIYAGDSPGASLSRQVQPQRAPNAPRSSLFHPGLLREVRPPGNSGVHLLVDRSSAATLH